MKKLITTALIIIIACFIMLCIAIPVGNNFIAVGVLNDIKSAPLPESTQIVESFSRAGKLSGNGNGMQYFGAILIKSELSLDELDKHYDGYGFTVKKQTEQAIEPIEIESASFSTDVSSGGYYIVYDYGDGGGAFFDLDIRGH